MSQFIVYKIESIINPEKIYIGSTINYKKRVKDHIRMLKSSTHKNRLLQAHFDQHGSSDFVFTIIESIDDKSQLWAREQFYIDALNPTFNICKVVGNSTGVKRTEEYKAKMSSSKKGKKHREECNLAKSIRMLGRKIALGYKHTEESKLNISKNNAKKREILQFTLDGVFMKEWPSIVSAANFIGITAPCISMCCRGVITRSGGYKWKYKK